jgi:hypothetical protein
MPSFQIMLLVLGGLFLALSASVRVAQLRADLARPLFWVILAAWASLSSFASLIYGKTGHVGTGLITRYGWPKPFYFITYPEVGAAMEGCGFIYFVGNTLLHGAVLLLVWTAWRARQR